MPAPRQLLPNSFSITTTIIASSKICENLALRCRSCPGLADSFGVADSPLYGPLLREDPGAIGA